MVDWQRLWSREYSVQYSEIALRSVSKEAEGVFGGFVTHQAMVPHSQGVESFFVDRIEWSDAISSIGCVYLSDRHSFTNFKRLFREIGERYLSECVKIGRYSGIKEELAEKYAEFYPVWRDFCAILWAGNFLGEEIAVPKAERILSEKKGSSLAQEIFRPSEKTEIAKAHDELSRLKREGCAEEELTRFHDKYSWLPCLDVQNAPWTLQETKQAIASAKTDKSEGTTKSLNEVLSGLDLNDEERFMLEAGRELVFIKDQRDVYRRKGVFLSRPFFETVGRACGQNAADVAYWTRDEIMHWGTTGEAVPLEIVKQRQEGFLLFEDKGKYVCYTGNEIPKRLESLGITIEKKKNEKSVKGIIGSIGLAEGPARLVRTVRDLDKVRAGDVMVAITTHPDFVPAMQRACAIVTDEGGLTCHAAIVCREFKIPCIVGTKKATSAFKDGDLLKVDAKKGIVEKIG